jgi:hypothetical protein
VAGTSPSLPLEAYVGTYADPLYGTAEVTLVDGTLRLSVGPFFQGRLEHWHFDTFRARWQKSDLGSAELTFQLDGDGEVVAVRVSGFDVFHREDEGS